MKKLALGVLAGWVIRGVYDYVWIHTRSYSEVITFKAEVDDEVKNIKEAVSEISELVHN